MIPNWTYRVTTLSGVGIGEIENAYERAVRHAFIGRLKTAKVKLRLDDPMADTVLNGQTLMKVYEGEKLRFIGPTVNAQEVGSDGGSVMANWASPFWRLHYRLLGKDTVGYRDGTPLALKDKTVLIANLLAAANASGYTGLDLGDTTNVGASGFLEYAPYKIAAEAMTEVVNNLDGPDIEEILQEPQTVAGGVRLATLNIAPVIGTNRPHAVFEYGTGKRNVITYNRAVDFALLNRGYALPSNEPGGVVASHSDATSIADFGLYEGLVQTDLPQALRQRLIEEHVRLRKIPRQVLTFTPARFDPARPKRVPRYGSATDVALGLAEFTLGDIIQFRAINPRTGQVRVDAGLRVYAVDWTIDNEGASVPTFTLVLE